MTRVVFALAASATAEPVSASALRSFARLDDNGDGALLDGLIAASREIVEAFTGRSLRADTWTAKLETWPEPDENGRRRVRLSPFPASISSVTVDGVALGAAMYTLLGDEAVFDIDLDSVPELDDVTDGIVIAFAARNDAASASLQLAVKMIAAHFYENREPVTDAALSAVPGLQMILLQQRVVRELN